MKKLAMVVLVIFVLSLSMSTMALAQESGWQQSYEWVKGWSWTGSDQN